MVALIGALPVDEFFQGQYQTVAQHQGPKQFS